MTRSDMIDHERCADERGATLVFFAISILAIFGLMGVVVDGGRAYSERRQMQNASDASALAGTRALDKVLFESVVDESTIYNAALSQATSNGSDPTTFECQLVDEQRTPLQACPETDVAGLPPNAAGVMVNTDNTRPTAFIQVVGQDAFTVAATATAQIQAVRGGSGPLLACAIEGGGEFQDIPIIVLVDPANPDYTDNWIVNPDPIVYQTVYNLHGSDSRSDKIRRCGGDSGWKGVAQEGTFAIPGYWDTKNGDTAGPTRARIATQDGCEGSFKDFPDGCKLLVPLCVGPEGPDDAQKKKMFCVAMGTFVITAADSNTHKAKFLGTAATVNEGGGGGLPVHGEAKLIKLTD